MCDGNLAMANVLEMEMPTKVCSKCQIEKDIIDFQKTPYSKKGRISICRQCSSEYRKKYNQELAGMMDAEIYFQGQKVSRIKAGRKIGNVSFGTTAAKYKIKMLGYDLSDKHVHHWNYDKDLDVILIGKKEHRFAHRFMVLDLKSKMYFANGTSILLDTKEKHIQFIETILDFFKMEKSIDVYDFTDFPKNSRISTYSADYKK